MSLLLHRVQAQQRHVLGAEVCMWGESMNGGNLFERAFQIGMCDVPRARILCTHVYLDMSFTSAQGGRGSVYIYIYMIVLQPAIVHRKIER